MCGIVGYIGPGNSADILLDSLGKLEYRGYDSSGIALVCGGGMKVIKSFGQIYNLKEKLHGDLASNVGIGHTRWATHGKPSEANAHPHVDCTGKIAVVHNGIIDNYRELKEMLVKRGHRFASETDTEVISHLIEEHYAGDMKRALLETVRLIKGSFALAIINEEDRGRIYAAKKESPIVIGVGDDQYYLASDVTAFIKYTRKAVFLQDGDIAILSKGGIEIVDFGGAPVSREAKAIEWNTEATEKAGYDYFMLKEIHEQPRSIMDTLAGRLNETTGQVMLGELSLTRRQMADVKRIILVACGTSYHAGILGKYALESLTDVPTGIEVASEFRYSPGKVDKNTLVVAITQSGETADTIAAVKEMVKSDIHVIAITNVAGSAISRIANDTLYTKAGPEIGVAATKTFTAQVVMVYLLAIHIARLRNCISADKARSLIASLKRLPQMAGRVLETDRDIASTARMFKDSNVFFFVGRHMNYPVALEGALKLKEISYVFSEAFAAGELKHGPLALITTNVPVVAIATANPTYDKMVSNIKEINARDASVIAIASEGDEAIKNIANLTLGVPDASEYISPILSSIVLQLFAYYIALYRGCPIDKPRNLAKCVTVE